MRVFAISSDFKKSEKKEEVKIAEGAIQSVGINQREDLLVAGSKDGTAYIMDLTKGCSIVKKLSFKPTPNHKNMMMRSIIFARDNSLYTLATYP